MFHQPLWKFEDVKSESWYRGTQYDQLPKVADFGGNSSWCQPKKSHIFAAISNHFWFIPSSKNLMIFKWCISTKGRILHLKHTEVISVFFTFTGYFKMRWPPTPSTPKNQQNHFLASQMPRISLRKLSVPSPSELRVSVQSSFLPCCTIHLLTPRECV